MVEFSSDNHSQFLLNCKIIGSNSSSSLNCDLKPDVIYETQLFFSKKEEFPPNLKNKNIIDVRLIFIIHN